MLTARALASLRDEASHRAPDGQVDDVVQRVDPEQQKLVVRGCGEAAEPGEREPEQADEQVDGSEDLSETLDGHVLRDLLGGR